jgi:hypothetical protein
MSTLGAIFLHLEQSARMTVILPTIKAKAPQLNCIGSGIDRPGAAFLLARHSRDKTLGASRT